MSPSPRHRLYVTMWLDMCEPIISFNLFLLSTVATGCCQSGKPSQNGATSAKRPKNLGLLSAATKKQRRMHTAHPGRVQRWKRKRPGPRQAGTLARSGQMPATESSLMTGRAWRKVAGDEGPWWEKKAVRQRWQPPGACAQSPVADSSDLCLA